MSVDLRAMAVRAAGLVSAAGVLLLTGCGAGVLAGPSPTAGFKINGNVHGGAYPIQGATIRLMETQSNGAWSTTTNSYGGTAKQLLQTTSDNNGYFTFPDTGWTCDAGQYAYITVSSGHTATATNNNVLQVGVIGSCSADLANKAEIDNVNVYISELSTVAAAYALGNFITIDDTNASTGQQLINITAPAANNSTSPGCSGTGNAGANAMTCTHAGLGNAFANAYNLVDQVSYGANQFPTGAARTVLPGNSQAVVPQALINTLGNILQSCVDSGGGTVGKFNKYSPGSSSSSHCGDLFYYATPPGSTTAPTNTLQAALNIARNPTNNVDPLFKLQPRAVFFTPDMSSDTLSNNSSQYMSYTLSVFYLGTGLTGDTGMPAPVDVALDDVDNAYVLYAGNTNGTPFAALNELGPDGRGVFAGPQQTRINSPSALALDSNGGAWVTNDSATRGNLFQINTPTYGGGPAGAIGNTYTIANGYAAGVFADMSNNIWVTRDAADNRQFLFRFDASNGYASTPFNTTPTLSTGVKRVFVDYRQNVLGVTHSGNAKAQVFLFPYTAGGAATTVYTTALNANMGSAVTMSNADVLYAPLYQELDTETGYTNGQMAANGAGSYTAKSSTNSTYSNPGGVGMDGAGNLFWTDYETAGQLFWFVPSSTTSVSNGTLTSMFPCYPINGQCSAAAASNLQGMAIDSSGALWYTAASTTGVVIQTLGLGAPTYPLQGFARNGVVIQ